MSIAYPYMKGGFYMKNEKVYPEWVQQQRIKGTTVKKVGNTYYLYKRTSKRVPGKKYPQPVDTYIGIITPDGIIERKRRQLATTSIKVKEYGFSKAVWDSCPDDWKKAVGEGWEETESGPTEMRDQFNDDLTLIEKYAFRGIAHL